MNGWVWAGLVVLLLMGVGVFLAGERRSGQRVTMPPPEPKGRSGKPTAPLTGEATWNGRDHAHPLSEIGRDGARVFWECDVCGARMVTQR